MRPSTTDRAIAPTTETSSTTPTTLAATDIYRQLVPSVVVITTEKGALGTGFVVTDTGTIMTANHVIDDGSAVSVIFADGNHRIPDGTLDTVVRTLLERRAATPGA